MTDQATPQTAHSDPTFRSYSSAQATKYAQERTGYSANLYDYVLHHHQASGGKTGVLLDVGCGPGNATRDLSTCFDTVIGTDPGEEMINTAKQLGGVTATGEQVKFVVSSAEDLDKLDGLQPGSVDLITAAMAAHWFDMPKFWATAAKLLKPGGSVALWTLGSYYCHPTTTPNAAEVQRILSHLEDDILGPYALPQNQLSRHIYRTLPLPWSSDPPVEGFDEASFLRREWDVDGVLTDGEDFFSHSSETTLEKLKSGLSTASMVTRWREANPGLAGTDQDCVVATMEEMRKAMGVEKGKEGEAKLKTGSATVILLVKKL